MSTSMVLKQILEVIPSEEKPIAGKRRRQKSKAPAPAHDQLVNEVKAHIAAEAALKLEKKGAMNAVLKPSKKAKAVLDKLLKRQRR